MKIGIDASQIVYGTGVSFYTSNLLRSLSLIDKENQFTVFASSFRNKLKLKKIITKLKLGENFKQKIFSWPPTFFEIFWNRMHFGNLENFIGPVDIFHSSDWTQPPVKKAKLVTTIHDLVPIKYPQYLPQRILFNHRQRLKWVEKEIDAVIAVSKATKNDIIKHLKIDPQKIQVIYEAIPKEHQIKLGKKEIIKVKEKYGLKDYILFVGTLEPRKNLKRTIEAFTKTLKTSSNSQTLKLVIVGKKGWKDDFKIFDLRSKMPGIKFLEEVDDKELVCLYAGAKCFVYPSLYEGFGLPVLEAMHHGCPVITSKISSLPEVAGEAAILINPNDYNEISQAINLVVGNSSVAQKLKEKGLTQVRKFSWEKNAKETMSVYNNLYRYGK